MLERTGHDADRPLRMEEPAGQPGLVLGRRLRERDGHHQPAAAGRAHVKRQLGRGLRHGARIRTTKAWTSSCSRCSCGRRWRRRETRCARRPWMRRDGSRLFSEIGCATCHTRDDRHGGAGHAHQRRRAQGGQRARATRRIRPFGDFLLHDIGTGDGIVQNGGQSTRNKVRTVPLWGLRTRGRFMHDCAQFQPDRRDSASRQPGAVRRGMRSGPQHDEQGQAHRLPVVSLKRWRRVCRHPH